MKFNYFNFSGECDENKLLVGRLIYGVITKKV